MFLTKQEPSRLASNEPGFFVLFPACFADICSSKNFTFAG